MEYVFFFSFYQVLIVRSWTVQLLAGANIWGSVLLVIPVVPLNRLTQPFGAAIIAKEAYARIFCA
jgi:hypothetical protein